ncbi:MAG: CDC27 family protein [Flavobacteriales bacterium]
MKSRSFVLVVATVLMQACSGPAGDPCATFFTPYPDLYSTTERTNNNARFLDALAPYQAKDYAAAATTLEAYVRGSGANPMARLYLASALLATGKPYEAEMHLDAFERSRLREARDEAEWYTLLCWVCSGQNERALPEAQRIAAEKLHTYNTQAAALAKVLAS